MAALLIPADFAAVEPGGERCNPLAHEEEKAEGRSLVAQPGCCAPQGTTSGLVVERLRRGGAWALEGPGVKRFVRRTRWDQTRLRGGRPPPRPANA
ncbi:hypothetical protein NDU88_003455 [Pleurodeles waltl]|uniref:Uncharacterized protein n=1 Tax=Pleurodeles waltl TaxID=8319 RepID=A0AAV7LH50_PLEWA|nr:hypothetical protein NDU88_003455 [Pleurodeles waltl]